MQIGHGVLQIEAVLVLRIELHPPFVENLHQHEGIDVEDLQQAGDLRFVVDVADGDPVDALGIDAAEQLIEAPALVGSHALGVIDDENIAGHVVGRRPAVGGQGAARLGLAHTTLQGDYMTSGALMPIRSSTRAKTAWAAR